MYHNRTQRERQISFSNKFNFKYFNEYDKIYIYSPNLHQELYQKLIKCFSSYIPINIIPNILNEEDIDEVNAEVINDKEF